MNVNKGMEKGAENLVKSCGCVKPDERILIISDTITKTVGDLILKKALENSKNSTQMISLYSEMHGVEPSDEIAIKMKNSDVIFCVTSSSMAHTKARIDASKKGARFLSLPDYSLELLEHDSLLIDYRSMAPIALKFKEILDRGDRVKITTALGTNLEFSIKGRLANFCPGYCDEPGMLGSPPDIETNIPPIESSSNGVIMVDGSIPCKELGLLKENVKLILKDGIITDIVGGVEAKALNEIFSKNKENAKVLAEFGIGFNPLAKLCGIMLEDEGCMKTVHFGFGSNSTIGGKNDISFHLDHVVNSPTVHVDGKCIMKDGEIQV